MSDLIGRFTAMPSYGIAALVVLLLYAAQSEIRFGQRARTHRAGAPDRKSTLAVSASAVVPILGFALAIKASSPSMSAFLPRWFQNAVMPGLPAIAWVGVVLAACGVVLRFWALLKLRERYTRTLLIQQEHSIERGGPYRWVRHPGYLGSLLCLNGIALASANWVTLLASLVATVAAYRYRIKVEDDMLVVAFGDLYVEYRRQVGALFPSLRSPSPSKLEDGGQRTETKKVKNGSAR
jgi:protein-S-isoprenylcysteine O-methyltransferase Ste14